MLPPTFKLNTGAEIPAVGFGTWQAPPGQVEQAVEVALKEGFRHIDCAAIYRNEKEVGAAIEKAGIKREELFITSKLWNTKHRPEDVEAALNKSLEDLRLDYVDLYLMHWPVAFKPGDKFFPLNEQGVFQLDDVDPVDTYLAMEKLLKTGKVKAIGISNFNIHRMEIFLPRVNIVPAVNQIEAHPYLQQPELVEYCKSKGILIEAYSPLGNNQSGEPRTVDDPKVHELAKKVDLDPGVLLLSWGVQRGTIVLSKSVTPSRIVANLHVRELPKEIFDELNALERHKRFNFPIRWGYDIFEEAGDEACKKAAIETGPQNLKTFTV